MHVHVHVQDAAKHGRDPQPHRQQLRLPKQMLHTKERRCAKATTLAIASLCSPKESLRPQAEEARHNIQARTIHAQADMYGAGNMHGADIMTMNRSL
jgi:hypothetical protein